jgi:hypothetical protein
VRILAAADRPRARARQVRAVLRMGPMGLMRPMGLSDGVRTRPDPCGRLCRAEAFTNRGQPIRPRPLPTPRPNLPEKRVPRLAADPYENPLATAHNLFCGSVHRLSETYP